MALLGLQTTIFFVGLFAIKSRSSSTRFAHGASAHLEFRAFSEIETDFDCSDTTVSPMESVLSEMQDDEGGRDSRPRRSGTEWCCELNGESFS